jgi:dCMP deaminase
MPPLIKWDKRFLDLAQLVSSWSKDPSTKVGAVVVDDDRRVISLGYNGFPRGVKDNGRLNDRESKYKIITHAEANALLFAAESLKGYSIYTYPFMPCSKCAGLIIQAGVRRVVSYASSNKRWSDDFRISRDMLCEAGVQVNEYGESFFREINLSGMWC